MMQQPLENLYQGRLLNEDVRIDADVCVVGSGAGGGTIAAELADGGLDVVILEEGGYFNTKDYSPDIMKSFRDLYRNGGASLFMGKPNVVFTEGQCVGGSTTVNGAICWRAPEKIIKRWQWEDGLTALSYKALEPIFEQVEKRINVAPQSPESIGADSRTFKKGADALGYRTTEIRRNQIHCVGANLCTNGCPTGAKQSTLQTYIPRALARGAQLYSDCRVQRILHDGHKVRGVTGRFRRPGSGFHGKIEVRAPIIVASGGATQTPILLQESKIRSESGLIGERVTLHPNIKAVGLYDEDLESWKGALQGWQINEFMEEGILLAISFVAPALTSMGFPEIGQRHLQIMERYNQMLTAGALIEDSDSAGRIRSWFGEPRMTYTMSDRDFHNLKRGLALASEVLFASGTKEVLLPVHGLNKLSSPDEIPKIFHPRVDRGALDEVLTVHAMGSCRMGGDPKTSVIGPFGEHHQLSGLFVADASIFPSPIGVNPQVTIMALATWIGQHIVEKHGRQ